MSGIILLSSSTGGNGAADAGKIARFDAEGGLDIGKFDAVASGDGALFTVRSATAMTAKFGNFSTGYCIETEFGNLAGTTGVSCHFQVPEQTFLICDGAGFSDETNVGLFSYSNGPAVVAADPDLNARVSLWGTGLGFIRFSTDLASATAPNRVDLKAQVATGARVTTLPDQTGIVVVVPPYADLTAANSALDAGDFFWDTTLKKLRQATA